MATSEQVKALLKSYGEGNGEHFASVALQIAADAARGGKGQLAQQLRDLVDEIKRKQSAGKIGGTVPIARPTGELASLLAASYPQTHLSEMVLFRRFDDVIRYGRPDPTQATALIRNRLRLFLGTRPVWKQINDAAAGLSHAEIARACDDAAKDCILNERGKVTTAMLVGTLQDRRKIDRSHIFVDGQEASI